MSGVVTVILYVVEGIALFLAALVCGQLFLGVESWLSKFRVSEWRQAQPLLVQPELLRSVHAFVGALIFATTVVVTLQAHRQVAWSGKLAAVPVGRLEGAALKPPSLRCPNRRPCCGPASPTTPASVNGSRSRRSGTS